MYFKGGWLRLNYNVESFMPNGDDADHVYLGLFPWYNVRMYWKVRIGNYLWNVKNQTWDLLPPEMEYRSNDYIIEVKLRDGKIVTNKTEQMNIDENDGFFIPINDTVLQGEVSITMLDAVVVATNLGYEPCTTHLIEGLELTYEQEQSLTYSKKNENRYKKHILNVGFKDNEEISLEIGTFNNNKQAVNLIRYIDGSYIEGVPYFVDAVNTETLRPELHLLNMLYDHYKEVRRIYTGVLKSRSWLPAERWMYGGRKFLAIISRRNWRTDTDDVKFLET
jgi:hypothetical protein